MPVIETAGATLFILGLTTQLSAGPTVAGATISGTSAFGIGLASTFIGGGALLATLISCQYRAYDKTLTTFDNFKKMKNDGKSDEEIIEQFRYFFDNNKEKAKEIKDEYFNGVLSKRKIEDCKTEIEAYKTTYQDETTEMKQAFQLLDGVLKIYQAKDKILTFEESEKLRKLKKQNENMSDQDFAKLLVLDHKIDLYHAANYATTQPNISKLSPVLGDQDDPVEETENKSFASSGSVGFLQLPSDELSNLKPNHGTEKEEVQNSSDIEGSEKKTTTTRPNQITTATLVSTFTKRLRPGKKDNLPSSNAR